MQHFHAITPEEWIRNIQDELENQMVPPDASPAEQFAGLPLSMQEALIHILTHMDTPDSIIRLRDDT